MIVRRTSFPRADNGIDAGGPLKRAWVGRQNDLSEKPRHGVESGNPALHPGVDERNSTLAIGLRAALALDAVRQSERARYYSSNDARWMTPDWSDGAIAIPYAHLGDPQSLNLYAYLGNNPLGGVDAYGHGWWKDFWHGLSNATWRPVVTLVRHPIVTGRAIGYSIAHPIATFHALRHGTVTTTQQVMTGNGTAVGTALGTVGMFFVPGGEAGDAAEGATDVSKVGEAAEAAEGAADTTTTVSQGASRAPKVGTPNSIYEQIGPDGNVRSRTFYDGNGHSFARQDFDHLHGGMQPHEHTRSFNANGQPITPESVHPLPNGYTNAPSQ